MKKKGQFRVPVSERALFARVDRTLKKRDEALRHCKEDSSSFNALGKYYIVDTARNVVVQDHVNLEGLATKLGILKSFEELKG